MVGKRFLDPDFTPERKTYWNINSRQGISELLKQY
jgi:hypothetical protein